MFLNRVSEWIAQIVATMVSISFYVLSFFLMIVCRLLFIYALPYFEHVQVMGEKNQVNAAIKSEITIEYKIYNSL